MANPTLIATADTYIDGKNATVSWGTATTAFVGVQFVAGVKGNQWRGLVRRLIPPEILAAEVYLAFLILDITSAAGGGVGAKVKRITSSGSETYWTESISYPTWNVRSAGNNWTTAGGDFTETGAIPFTTPSTIGPFSIDITGLVQDAITSRSGLLDLIMAVDGENPAESHYFGFTPREVVSLTAANPTIVIVRPPFGMPMSV